MKSLQTDDIIDCSIITFYLSDILQAEDRWVQINKTEDVNIGKAESQRNQNAVRSVRYSN